MRATTNNPTTITISGNVMRRKTKESYAPFALPLIFDIPIAPSEASTMEQHDHNGNADAGQERTAKTFARQRFAEPREGGSAPGEQGLIGVERIFEHHNDRQEQEYENHCGHDRGKPMLTEFHRTFLHCMICFPMMMSSTATMSTDESAAPRG